MTGDQTRSGTISLASRLVIGAIAGFTATMAMTGAMRRLHERLPEPERYPLPPREITETMMPGAPDALVKDIAMSAHFLYGAATGTLLAAARVQPGPVAGALYGLGIWAASYFGWVPAFGILTPAHRHPGRRNALMIGVHLVWGAATAIGIAELTKARSTMLEAGPLADRA